MTTDPLVRRIVSVSLLTGILLALAWAAGVALGSSDAGLATLLGRLWGDVPADDTRWTIIRCLRFPRVMLATLVGAGLSLGGLVFQDILRNPLAEPYVLGVSGGAAVGAIIGIMMGLAAFPGTALTAFAGSMATLVIVIWLPLRQAVLHREMILLAGVMINALCGAAIMFMVSMSTDARLHRILYWLMGDLAGAASTEVLAVGLALLPCFLIIFFLSHRMNLLLLGQDMAQTMGVNVRRLVLTLLTVTSLMVGLIVSMSGLVGFVGLVIPHTLRLWLGADHRVLVPACILGGGAYLTICDLLARMLPQQGELPVGVVTALIGAPMFIFFLFRSKTWATS